MNMKTIEDEVLDILGKFGEIPISQVQEELKFRRWKGISHKAMINGVSTVECVVRQIVYECGGSKLAISKE
jgi:hypothetical protein